MLSTCGEWKGPWKRNNPPQHPTIVNLLSSIVVLIAIFERKKEYIFGKKITVLI